ncbi:hypothetical protein Psta_2059 [Pirellula staleyi DSM 6068]|uniref:Uncharacterized protein n=1 Tax=Pirellula staleyi (strain ATCC 27377 / DSM 6068 / ICPB 4128) TaxID=530564 RepID=D2R1L4_PIRSD|nr:hypothetical protein [Pirellula staleyi]ADB16733.1 hypothetical protein Psta_2059 [Pirellula staleyi DSM 6068]
MNDRARALHVLKDARDILARRLTERVLEMTEEILADARGDSYMNDIENVYEALGMRLSHVTQMISNLPPDLEPTTTSKHASAESMRDDTFTLATETTTGADAMVADTTPALAGPVFVATPALPAPHQEESPRSPASFQRFATLVQSGDVEEAGITLAELFELPEDRGIACAEYFAGRLHSEPGFVKKAMQLRAELLAGSHNAVMVLLYECFGLVGLESIGVMQVLHRRLSWGS